MTDVHGQFDTSDIPEPGSVEAQATPETGESFGEEFESRHEKLKVLSNSKADLFRDDTVRIFNNMETRYGASLDAEEAQEEQSLLKDVEGLRARLDADMTAVAEDRYTPNSEKQSAHTELRAKRNALDKEWEILSETVMHEGANESAAAKHALKSGEDLPPMTEAGKRLNHVLKEIFAIDKKLASMPGPAIETSPQEGTDANPILLTEEMRKTQAETERATPPPPPGSEGRGALLKSKIDAEQDPAKKAELTIQALDEKLGSDEMVFEKAETTPIETADTATETTEATPVVENPQTIEDKPTGNVPKMWQAMYPDEDFVSSEDALPKETPSVEGLGTDSKEVVPEPQESVPEVKTPSVSEEKKLTPPESQKESAKLSNEDMLSFVAGNGENKSIEDDTAALAEKKEQEIDPRDAVNDLMEESVFLEKLRGNEMHKTTEKWIADHRGGLLGPGATPEAEIAKLEYQVKNFVDRASFKKFLIREGEKHPELTQIAEGIHAISDEDMEFLLKGYQTAIKDEILALENMSAPAELEHAMAEEVAAAMSGELSDAMEDEEDPEVLAAMQAFADKKNLDIPTDEKSPTHSERHEVNAEAFGKLVQELDAHLEKLVSNDIDLGSINTAEQLLDALGNTGAVSQEDASGLKSDMIRRNVLMTKFNKVKDNHKKK